MIVEKAANMAAMMNIPVLGIVENMSYFKCDQCGKEHHIFGQSHVEEIAERRGIPNVARLPIDPAIARSCDAGAIEDFEETLLDAAADKVVEFCSK
jgi:Mrp family chromosome partitioning ATPase